MQAVTGLLYGCVYNPPMPRRRIDVRLDEELLAWLDQRAKALGVTRTALLEEAVQQMREAHGAARGRPIVRVPKPQAPEPVRKGDPLDYREMMAARQQRLERQRRGGRG